MEQSTIYVLSLDGGGVRGIIQVEFLKKLQRMLKMPICEKFHVLTGVSSGAVISLIMAQRHDIKSSDLCIYSDSDIKTVVYKSIWDKMVGVFQLKPKYDGTGKTKILSKYLTNDSVNNFSTRVIIPICVKTDNSQPLIVDSKHHHVNRRDLADAASAMPTYFPTCKLKISGVYYNCVDGGLSRNNPSTMALSILQKENPGKKIKILSIGTGKESIDLRHQYDCGLMKCLCSSLIGTLLEAPNQLDDMLLQSDDYLRINDDISFIGLAPDDSSPEYLQKLRNVADDWFELNKDRLKRFFGV